MKKFNFLSLLFVVLFSSIALTSCLGDDDDEKEENCYEELQRLGEIANEKAMAFSNNMTSSTCSAWKTAATNFYNKAKQCGDADMISAAEHGLEVTEMLDCSDF